MSGRIVSGRQEPEHGSRRDVAMTYVKAWLLKHGRGRTPVIAQSLGYSVNRVSDALLDLHLFDPDVVISIPAPKNDYQASLRWVDIRAGEINQARHYRTRAERLAIRWAAIAVKLQRDGEPVKAQMFRDGVVGFEAEVARMDVLLAAM